MKNIKVCSSNFCTAYAVLIILFWCQELTTFTPWYECVFLVPVNGDKSTFKVKELFIPIQFVHETPRSGKGEFLSSSCPARKRLQAPIEVLKPNPNTGCSMVNPEKILLSLTGTSIIGTHLFTKPVSHGLSRTLLNSLML